MQDAGLPREQFVRYLNKDFPSGVKVIDGKDAGKEDYPIVTVIIPTLDAYRDGYFPKLLEEIKKQNFQNFELIIVEGDPRQGRAINTAASIAKGHVLIILDDDISFGHERVFENLVKALQENPGIGMAGVSNLIPQNAGIFVKRAMKELPRRDSALVNKITDSDMAEHPCCAIPKKLFYEAGGEREDAIRGLDPYLRYVIRSLGYRVAVIPGTWISHLPPKTLLGFIRYAFGNGKSTGIGRKLSRDLPIETPDGHVSDFIAQRSFLFRLPRFFWRLIYSIAALKFIYFSYLIVYSLGFIYGRFMVKEKE